METNTSRTINIYKAMLAAQKAMGKVYKNATNPHFKSSYADLAAIVETITEPIHDQGLFHYQPLVVVDGKQHVKTILVHAESGETLESLVEVKSKDDDDPQKMGAAITYYRRYSLLSFFGLAPEDDDGKLASTPQYQHQSSAPPIEPKPQYTALDEECEYPGCDGSCSADFVGWSRKNFGQVYCRIHSAMAKRGELSDPKENIETIKPDLDSEFASLAKSG